MKPHYRIYTLIVVLFLAQACGSTKEKNNEEASSVTKAETGLSAQERKAIHKKDSARIAEQRVQAWKDLIAKTPSYTDQNGTIVFNKSEVDPSFVGGEKAMRKYLRANILYPEQAEKDGLEGTVFVDFIIANDGSIDDVKVTNATSMIIDSSFKDEAVRVVSTMPKWTPGRQNDKAVNVQYSIPITFRMR